MTIDLYRARNYNYIAKRRQANVMEVLHVGPIGLYLEIM